MVRVSLAMAVAALAAIAPPPILSQSARPAPTFDWVFSDETRRIAALPSYAWLEDGSLLVYDSRRPAGERAFEGVDPRTGVRRPAFDMAAAVASLRALLPADAAPAVLPWPDALDAAGRRALWAIDDDLFVVDFASSRVVRLTATPAREHAAEFSPDGAHVAFVRENDLHIADVDSGAERRLTRSGSAATLNGTLSWLYWEEIFGRRDVGHWWAPDGRALAFLETDESGMDTATFVDFAPLTPRVVTQRYPKAGRPNPRVRVGIVHLDTGATTWVQLKDRPFELVVRVKWLPDSARLSVQTLTRDQRELGLYIADAATGSATRVLTETDPGYVNVHDDLHFLPGGRHFLWASERDGHYHVYRYTTDGRLVNQVTRGPWALASSGGPSWVRQAVAGIDPAGDTIFVTALAESSVERHLYRVRVDGSALTRLTMTPGVHRIAMSPDAAHYVDAFSDVRTLPSLALRRTSDGRDIVLAPPRTDLLAPYDILLPELTTIPARDGFAMPARVLMPARVEPGRRYPVVLAVYGGASSPMVMNAWQSDVLFYQLLAAEGYAVVKVDNRAATGISKHLENTVVGRLGAPEADDLLDAVRWLKAQPWVDGTRVGVWGWSHGGYMTLNLLTRSTEFKAGIAVNAVTDWRYYDTKWAEAFLGLPADNPEAYDRASVVRRAPSLHGRLLLVYGSHDDNVHPQNAEAMIDALVRAGRTFDLMVYPMRKHDIGDREANAHLYRTMVEFWKRWL